MSSEATEPGTADLLLAVDLDGTLIHGDTFFESILSYLGSNPLGAFALALVFSLRDLETAVLLYPPGGEPLTARIFTLEANGPPGVVSALAILHVLITFGAIGLAWLTLKSRNPA